MNISDGAQDLLMERIIWCVKTAQPVRACTIATFIGSTAGEVERLLNQSPLVESVEYANQKHWKLK